MHWKEEMEEEEEEEEEEVGRQEALAWDTRTRHTINTIFALPLHPTSPSLRSTPSIHPSIQPSIHLSIHPSIYPSRGAGMTEESETAVVHSLSMHTRVWLRT